VRLSRIRPSASAPHSRGWCADVNRAGAPGGWARALSKKLPSFINAEGPPGLVNGKAPGQRATAQRAAAAGAAPHGRERSASGGSRRGPLATNRLGAIGCLTNSASRSVAELALDSNVPARLAGQPNRTCERPRLNPSDLLGGEERFEHERQHRSVNADPIIAHDNHGIGTGAVSEFSSA